MTSRERRGSAAGGACGYIPGPRSSADVAGYGYIPHQVLYGVARAAGHYHSSESLWARSMYRVVARIRSAISCSDSQLPS